MIQINRNCTYLNKQIDVKSKDGFLYGYSTVAIYGDNGNVAGDTCAIILDKSNKQIKTLKATDYTIILVD